MSERPGPGGSPEPSPTGPADHVQRDQARRGLRAAGAERTPIPSQQLGSVNTEGMDSLGRLLLASESVSSVLHRAASYAQRTLPGADEVSVTLTTGRRSATAAWTGLLAFELDECQYGLGYGPCLQAAATGRPVVVDDLRTETRWPAYTDLALQQGARSSLSVPIPIGDSAQAALNSYATRVGAFSDPLDTAAAMRTAGQVSAAIANMHDLDSTRTQVQHLQSALESRAGIEQAKGILMAIHGYSADQAFQVLSTRSQTSNTKLRDVAVEVIAQVRRGRADPS